MIPTSPDGYRSLPGQLRSSSTSRIVMIGALFVMLAAAAKYLLSDDPAARRSGTVLPVKITLLAVTAILAVAEVLLIRAQLRARRANKARARGLSDYWREDHDWAGPIAPNGGRSAAFLAASTLLGCVIGASIFAFTALGERDSVGAIVLTGMAAFSVLCSIPPARELLLWLRFRSCELAFLEPLPLRPGKQAQVRLTTDTLLAAPKAQLRLVQEYGGRFNERRMIREGSASVAENVRADGRTELRLSVFAPADAPSTLLSEDAPRYWELEVADDSRGFEARFLMPVYSIDGAS